MEGVLQWGFEGRKLRLFLSLLALTHLVLLSLLVWATAEGFRFHFASMAALALAGTLIGLQDLWLVQWVHRRARCQIQSLQDLDSVPGLYAPRTFTQRVEEEVSRSIRHSGTFSIARLSFEPGARPPFGFHRPLDRMTLRAALKALRGNIRQEDCLTKVRSAEYLLLLPNTGPVPVCLLAERLVQHFRDVPVGGTPRGAPTYLPLQISTATYPVDGTDAQEILEVTKERLASRQDAPAGSA